jgi:hypothetical protein
MVTTALQPFQKDSGFIQIRDSLLLIILYVAGLSTAFFFLVNLQLCNMCYVS